MVENGRNPWEEINLTDYESHMSLGTVQQLQAMNRIMKRQFSDYPVESAMVLGIAGGNGLEHVSTDKYKAVYGVDINPQYLKKTQDRFARLSGCLHCIRLDLTKDTDQLPQVGLIIANLLVEYIGYPAFQKAVQRVSPQYVSCVIQVNADEKEWVSDSPYLHVFDRLEEIHQEMEASVLTAVMSEIGYQRILQENWPLPNGKSLVRLDYQG